MIITVVSICGIASMVLIVFLIILIILIVLILKKRCNKERVINTSNLAISGNQLTSEVRNKHKGRASNPSALYDINTGFKGSLEQVEDPVYSQLQCSPSLSNQTDMTESFYSTAYAELNFSNIPKFPPISEYDTLDTKEAGPIASDYDTLSKESGTDAKPLAGDYQEIDSVGYSVIGHDAVQHKNKDSVAKDKENKRPHVHFNPDHIYTKVNKPKKKNKEQ